MKRAMIKDSMGLVRPAEAGDGVIAPLVKDIATDNAITLTAADLTHGFINLSGFTAGRNVTTPTAALILAAFPTMDIGEYVEVIISSEKAFAGTFVAGTDVTLDGKATVAASSHVHVLIRKDSATTVTWIVL